MGRWRPSHHDSGDVFGIVSVQVELERHHLVVVRLQLTLHHPVHFIRELQRRRGSTGHPTQAGPHVSVCEARGVRSAVDARLKLSCGGTVPL